jgi:ELWxxDGT repeat protein
MLPRLFLALLVMIAMFIGSNSAAYDYAPTMVRDINSETVGDPFSSEPIEMVSMGGVIYFAARDVQNNGALWRSDGTAEGTQLIKAFPRPLTYPSFSGEAHNTIVTVGDKLFFTPLDTITYQSRLWVSDGTAAGTRQLSALPAKDLTAFGSYVYFVSDGALWRSDGTEAGTILVQVMPNPINSIYTDVPSIRVAANRLFLLSRTDDTDLIYTSDGSPDSLIEIERLPRALDVPPLYLTAATASTYYFVFNGDLYATNGTVGAAQRVYTSTRTGPIPDVRNLFVSENTLYFTDDQQLFVITNGQTTPRLLNTTVYGHYNYVSATQRVITAAGNGAIYFSGYTPETGQELWRSDGTPEGTQVVADIWPGSQSSRPSNMVLLDNTLYFSANDGQSGDELWASDGTATGTRQVRDIRPGPLGSAPQGSTSSNIFSAYPIEAAGTLYFAANDGIHGSELWKSDGSREGTQMVIDLTPQQRTQSSSPSGLVAYQEGVLFTATAGGPDTTLWASNGLERGTQQIFAGLPVLQEDGTPVVAQVGALTFFISSNTLNQGLYVTDGSAAGTQLLKAIDYPSFNLVPFRNGIAFAINTSEIWISDGTIEGTTLLLNTLSTADNTALRLTPQGAIKLIGSSGGRLVFQNLAGEIYSTDGTAASLRLLASNAYQPPEFIATTGRAYIIIGSALYVSDATVTSLQLVRQLEQAPMQAVKFGERLLFMLNDQLWISDGTQNGTRLLITNPYSDYESYILGATGDLAFIAFANDLWRSDGTPEGTVRIRGFSGPTTEAVIIDNNLAFIAYTNGQGANIWVSDGTLNGTFPLINLPPIAFNFNPQELTASGKFLFFSADDGTHGQELWAARIEFPEGGNPYPLLSEQKQVWLPLVR